MHFTDFTHRVTNILIFPGVSKTHWNLSWPLSQYYFLSPFHSSQRTGTIAIPTHTSCCEMDSENVFSGPETCNVAVQEILKSYHLTLQGCLKTRSQIPSMLSVEDAQIPSIETMEHSALELPSPQNKDCQRMPPSSFFHSLKFSPEHICSPPFKTQVEREIFTKWPARPGGHHHDISHVISKTSHQGKEYIWLPPLIWLKGFRPPLCASSCKNCFLHLDIHDFLEPPSTRKGIRVSKFQAQCIIFQLTSNWSLVKAEA